MAENKCAQIIVLVVEDEALVRLVVADALVEAGCPTVLEAGDADEAVALLEAHPGIGAVITDIDMPGSADGLGLAGIVRSRWPRVPVLLTSGRIRPARTWWATAFSISANPISPRRSSPGLKVSPD